MRKREAPSIRYICPRCAAVYEILTDELNNSEARCLKCDSPLIKSKRR